VPVENHSEIWRRSTVPVFGIVYDPDDSQIRWVDLTGYLRAHPEQSGGEHPSLGPSYPRSSKLTRSVHQRCEGLCCSRCGRPHA
jgi:hypothetical protein